MNIAHETYYGGGSDRSRAGCPTATNQPKIERLFGIEAVHHASRPPPFEPLELLERHQQLGPVGGFGTCHVRRSEKQLLCHPTLHATWISVPGATTGHRRQSLKGQNGTGCSGSL
jgi:hypothetical protein